MSYLPWAVPAALMLSGCGGAGDDPCRPGFVRAEDGHCYPPPPDPGPPSATDVLLGLGPCEPLKPGPEIDLLTGCLATPGAEGAACPGDAFDAVDLAWERGADCAINGSATLWTCDWSPGLEAAFAATDTDTVQPRGDATTTWVRALSTFPGATTTGLGTAISPACWVEVLGAPTTADFVDSAGALAPYDLYWDPNGVELSDTVRASDGLGVPDGLVDRLTLFGPP